MLQDYTYYHITHHKILVLMCLLHNRPKFFILSIFRSFSVVSTTTRNKKVCNSAIVHPMELFLVTSCSSLDSASDSIVFITQLNVGLNFRDGKCFLEKLALHLYRDKFHHSDCGFLS